ncbi:MAG TPA: ThuA domain-containing protein [Chryseolinea sp.]|nr:ThuA domain-containing protein [Chryseolinea sp.]
MKALFLFLLVSFNMTFVYSQTAQAVRKNFRILVLAENGGHHLKFTQAAKPWLNQLAKENQFAIDYIEKTDVIDSAYLSNYQLFLQLDYPPYGWPEKAAKAFENYINNGKGGWIGLHHATLLGEFDGYPMWTWFSNFMGGIRFKNYIPTFADGQVSNEETTHPVMKNLPQHFVIEREEWYTYDKTPRSKVNVLASVNENTYKPDSEIKMGDHPVIWTNPSVRARNVYIFMGHSPDLLANPYFTTILKNAIFWAAAK